MPTPGIQQVFQRASEPAAHNPFKERFAVAVGRIVRIVLPRPLTTKCHRAPAAKEPVVSLDCSICRRALSISPFPRSRAPARQALQKARRESRAGGTSEKSFECSPGDGKDLSHTIPRKCQQVAESVVSSIRRARKLSEEKAAVLWDHSMTRDVLGNDITAYLSRKLQCEQSPPSLLACRACTCTRHATCSAIPRSPRDSRQPAFYPPFGRRHRAVLHPRRRE